MAHKTLLRRSSPWAVEDRLYLKLRSLASPVYFEAHARGGLTFWNFFRTNIDLRVLGRVVVTLFSSGNFMVLLRAVTLRRLHQLRRGCLNDLHYSNILLTAFMYHFKMKVSECAGDGHTKIWSNVQKSVWKDWQKTRNTQSGCMKCGRYS